MFFLYQLQKIFHVGLTFFFVPENSSQTSVIIMVSFVWLRNRQLPRFRCLYGDRTDAQPRPAEFISEIHSDQIEYFNTLHHYLWGCEVVEGFAISMSSPSKGALYDLRSCSWNLNNFWNLRIWLSCVMVWWITAYISAGDVE